jgi:hypothetical protein
MCLDERAGVRYSWKTLVLEVCLARFMFASGESACRFRARPDQPPSFASPAVVDQTALMLMAAPRSVGVRS